MDFSKILCATDKVVFKLSKAHKYEGCFLAADLPEGFTVTCHAGAYHTKANSLQSIEVAVSNGAKVIEFDVSFRPDGTPVIIHNSNPEANEGVLFSDAVDIIAKTDECLINLDIKSTANLSAVDKIIREKGLFERVFYTGVFADWVNAVKSSSSIPYYLNHPISDAEASDETAAQAVADKAKALGAFGINSNFRNATPLFVEKMRENGLLVSLWTVNNAENMVRVLKLRPDNITTKKPDLIKMIIR